mgnify:CR=1 FL=1
MNKYEIRYDKDACMSHYVCRAEDPEHFTEGEDGKTRLVNGEYKDGIQVLEIDESEKEDALKAVEGCPVMALELVDKTTEERIAP